MGDNQPALWRKIDNYYQYYAPGYAVYATVTPIKGSIWEWDVRVMFDCERPDGERTKGVALTLDGAKRIVELVCHETGTCEKYKKEPK